ATTVRPWPGGPGQGGSNGNEHRGRRSGHHRSLPHRRRREDRQDPDTRRQGATPGREGHAPCVPQRAHPGRDGRADAGRQGSRGPCRGRRRRQVRGSRPRDRQDDGAAAPREGEARRRTTASARAALREGQRFTRGHRRAAGLRRGAARRRDRQHPGAERGGGGLRHPHEELRGGVDDGGGGRRPDGARRARLLPLRRCAHRPPERGLPPQGLGLRCHRSEHAGSARRGARLL
ncbi:unnamed protein product, partial [Penicillium discolor]